MGFEYALIYVNMSIYARILNIPESTKIYLNVDKYNSMSNIIWLNLTES